MIVRRFKVNEEHRPMRFFRASRFDRPKSSSRHRASIPRPPPPGDRAVHQPHVVRWTSLQRPGTVVLPVALCRNHRPPSRARRSSGAVRPLSGTTVPSAGCAASLGGQADRPSAPAASVANQIHRWSNGTLRSSRRADSLASRSVRSSGASVRLETTPVTSSTPPVLQSILPHRGALASAGLLR